MDEDGWERAVLAAETSRRSGGAVLPEARGYNLPPMVTGLEIAQMGYDTWVQMRNAATWRESLDRDIMVNLDHPDVKAVL